MSVIQPKLPVYGKTQRLSELVTQLREKLHGAVGDHAARTIRNGMVARGAALSCAVVTAAALMAGVPPAAAGDAMKELLLKGELHGTNGLEGNVVLFDVDPGWETERHIHPGNVFVYVTDGTVELDMEGEETKTLSAGDVVHELPNHVMIMRNASTTERARFVAFLIVSAGEALTVPAPE